MRFSGWCRPLEEEEEIEQRREEDTEEAPPTVAVTGIFMRSLPRAVITSAAAADTLPPRTSTEPTSASPFSPPPFPGRDSLPISSAATHIFIFPT